jgi:hypothetical protein
MLLGGTKRHGGMVNNPAAYFGGFMFKYRLGDLLS